MRLKIKHLFILILFLISVSAFSATWKKIVSDSTIQVCPLNYIFVPSLSPYTTRDFCVMKYEAKDDIYGALVSTAAGEPWTELTRDVARMKCKALGPGYDMISNDQWQTIARNIAIQPENWSTGTATSGMINTGNVVGEEGLAASTDDNDPCFGITGAGPCSGSTWNARRRTHVLSNGNKIWDFSGNKGEWVTNDNDNVSKGGDGYIAAMTAGDIRQTRYGAQTSTICVSPGVGNDYCGMGYGTFNLNANGTIRGGDSGDAGAAGIFRVEHFPQESKLVFISFRCILSP